MTALVYLITSITLAVIFAFSRSTGHVAAGGVEVFRYQPGLLRVLIWGSPTPLILMIFVYLVTTPRMSNFSLALLLMFGAIGSALVLLVYRNLNSYRVEVGGSGVSISKARSSTYIDFLDIQRVDYVEGDKGVNFIDLYNASGRRIAHLAGTLQDFDELHRLIKEGATKCSAAYRRRDKWGNWK